MASNKKNEGPIAFFHVSTAQLDGSGPDLQDVNGRSCRQRRRHGKSKEGCDECKARRVKCDEARPSCRNCIRRNESCSLRGRPRGCPLLGSKGSNITQALRPAGLVDSLSEEVNMVQTHLVHHFGSVTADTLIFEPVIWRDRVLSVGLKYDYLLHAILLVSSAHLQYLEPSNKIYRKATIMHFGRALQSFRVAIAQPVNNNNADAYMATALLLYHYVWSNIDFTQPTGTSSTILDLSNDALFTLAAGIRDVFSNAVMYLQRQDSVFTLPAAYRPKHRIVRAARNGTKVPADFDALLQRYFRHLNTSPEPNLDSSTQTSVPPCWLGLNQDQPSSKYSTDDVDVFNAYMDASSRLSPLLSLCKVPSPATSSEQSEVPSVERPESGPNSTPLLSKPTIDQSLMPDIARYLFSFPIRALPTFNTLIRQSDVRALIVLLYFYRGARALLSQTSYGWWADARAQAMEKAIYHALDSRGYSTVINEEEKTFGAAESVSKDAPAVEDEVAGSPCFFHQLWTQKFFPWGKDVSHSAYCNNVLMRQVQEMDQYDTNHRHSAQSGLLQGLPEGWAGPGMDLIDCNLLGPWMRTGQGDMREGNMGSCL